MNKKRCLLFLFWLIYTSHAIAQQMGFTNISGDLKLPALECYKVFQDKKGYIWISTEAGICRYDGANLKLITDAGTSPNEAVYAITQTEDSTIWMATSKSRILFFRDDSLYEAPFSQTYKKLVNDPLSIPYLLTFGPTGNLYINSKLKTVLVDKDVKEIKIIDKNHIHADYIFLKTEAGLMPIDNGNSLITGATIKIGIIDGNGQRYISIPYHQNFSPHWQTFTCNVGNTLFFTIENLLVRVNEDFSYVVYPFSNRILNVYADNTDGLWVSPLKGGLLYYPDINRMAQVSQNLDSYSITSIYEDHEHGIWATTLERGVFYCKNKNITYYANVPGLNMATSLLKHEAGYTFAGSEGHALFTLTPYATQKHALSLPAKFIFSDILFYDQRWLLTSRQGMVSLDKNLRFDRLIVSKSQPFSGMVARCKVTESGALLVIHYTAYKQIHVSHPVSYRIHDTKINIRSFLPLKNGTLLLGAQDGLYLVDEPFQSEPRKLPGIDAPVMEMIYADDQIWIASKNGLWVFRNDSLLQINKLLHIPSNIYFDITRDRADNIWVASNIGLVKITKQEKYYQAKLYNTSHGLISSEVYKVAAGDGEVYMSTAEGVCSFPINGKLTNVSPPRVYLAKLEVNGRAVDAKRSKLVFPHDENSVNITLDALSFKKSDTRLLYRFTNLDDNTFKRSGNNQIALVNLSPGEYALEIFAVNSDGVKSIHPLYLSFSIEKPFWQTTWFILSCILVFTLVSYAAFSYLLIRIRRREQKETRINQLIAESKLSALQAQMNPHFIFNAINSIQNYILKKNEQDAYDYLAKFSKLVRTILNNSRQRTLTLATELETVKLYVELERLRFKNNFDFVLDIDEEVEVDEINVPTMLMQPYIENAIWHGLMQLENKNEGILRMGVSVEKEGEHERLKITIQDNGIGRKKSGQLKKDDYHTPVAIALTEQRLEIINRLQGFESTNVTITDLYNSVGKACGTKVEIWIPINNNNF